MKRVVAATLLALIASAHVAMSQSAVVPPSPIPPAQTVPMEALQDCQDFTFSLRTQREQVLDAAAAAHTQLTKQARTIVALQQENAALKAELAKLKAAAN